MSLKICSIEGCENKIIARGWCGKHYARWHRHGHPKAGGRRFSDPEEAFAVHAERQGSCLIWAGDKHASGYGRIWADGKRGLAHRYAWERVNGRIPDGMEVDHVCHNTLCVDVEHLRLATRQENNSYLAGPASDNKNSGVRNVYRNQNRWMVQIGKGGKSLYFGTYPTVDEAAAVAEEKRAELFGEFAGKG